MASIGEELRMERTRKGLTFKDVEQVLHIRSAYLEAIEEGNFGLIPGEVYVKGFIRNYANFLGLDGQRLINAYKDLTGEEAVVKVRPMQLAKTRKLPARKKTKTREPAPAARLTYEGRQLRRRKTIAQEQLIMAVILVLVALFLLWLFFF